MNTAGKMNLAMSEIDDKLIEEASGEYKVSSPIKKYIAIAACVAVVTVAAVGVAVGILLNGGINGNSDLGLNGGANNMEGSVREPVYGDFGSIKITKSTDDTITFTLTNLTNCSYPIDISLFSDDASIIYTTADYSGFGLVIKPNITVDGVASDELPPLKGEYEVTVSFNGISSLGTTWNDYIVIDGFKPLYHGLKLN